MKTRYKLAAIAAVVVLLGAVGQMDYEDAVAEQLQYCENVKAGIWPDYNKSFEDECTSEKVEEFKNILR